MWLKLSGNILCLKKMNVLNLQSVFGDFPMMVLICLYFAYSDNASPTEKFKLQQMVLVQIYV